MHKTFRWWAIALTTCLCALIPLLFFAPPDFKAQAHSHYYAATTPQNIPPFDYAYYDAHPSKPVLVEHPEYAEELVIRAFLKGAIGYAEGTYKNSKGIYSYDVIVGFIDRAKVDKDYSDHYRHYNPDADSDAAGLGQFMSFTWDGLRKRYKNVWYDDLPAFHPKNQDIGLLLLLYETRSYEQLIRGTSVDESGRVHMDVERFTNAVNQACNIWMSFPDRDGRGCGVGIGINTQDGVKPIEKIWESFQTALEEEQALFLPPAAAAPAPVEQPIVSEKPSGNPEDLFPDDMKLPAKDGEVIPGKDGASYPITDVRRFREKNPVTGAAGYNRWHDGYDIGIEVGVALYTPMPGKAVCHIGYNSGFGNYVEFFPLGLDGRSFVFKHLNDCEDVNAAQAGELFGHTGNTGFGSGPHGHFAGWRYVGGKWEHFEYAKGWMTAFLTGKLPQK